MFDFYILTRYPKVSIALTCISLAIAYFVVWRMDHPRTGRHATVVHGRP